MLFACYVTVLAYLCAFESIAAFQVREVLNNSSHDERSGPLGLANYVIKTIEHLSRGKSVAEAKADFQEIVQLATRVLEEADAGDQVPKTTSDEAVSNLTAIQAAIKLDGEMGLLLQYAHRLLESAGESSEEEIVIIVIAILQRAKSIPALIDISGIDYISYNDRNEERRGVSKRGGACLMVICVIWW